MQVAFDTNMQDLFTLQKYINVARKNIGVVSNFSFEVGKRKTRYEEMYLQYTVYNM